MKALCRWKVIALCTILIFNMGCARKQTQLQTQDETNNPAQDQPALTPEDFRAAGEAQWEKDQLLTPLAVLPDVSYTVYTSQSMDTYLLACALLFDFKSPVILPENEDGYYQSAIRHFEPYKEHAFIQGLSPYVDLDNKDINQDVMWTLGMYNISQTHYGIGVDMVQNSVFNNGGEFQQFLDGLYSFYRDAQVALFLAEDMEQRRLKEYISASLDLAEIGKLIAEMEAYTGNQQELFGDSAVYYITFLSLYRPFMASYYDFYMMGNDVYLTTMQSPFAQDNPAITFDMEQMALNTVHELLHHYINPPVAFHYESILEMAEGKNPLEYTSPLYQEMPWHRIVDESIVRVVEYGICRQVWGDPEKAWKMVLEKEILFGGMDNLENLAEVLSEYEENRAQYEHIGYFIQRLIQAFFENPIGNGGVMP